MADAERERDDDDFDEDAPSSKPSSSSFSSTSSPAPAPPSSMHPAALGKTCALCGVDFSGGRKLMRCSGCRLAHYCSREHQAAHWRAHAEACNAEQARVKAQLSESGLVLGAEAVREAAERRAEDERAAAVAVECARIEALDASTLRLELDRRGALAALAADASREALVAARLLAPAPTPESLAAAGEREQRALDLRQCRSCEKAIPAEPASTGRCAGCKRVRYCGTGCQRGDWPRHKPECKAWKDEAIVAAGGCPLGDLRAQQAAIAKWDVPERTLAETRKAAEGGDLAAQYVLGWCFYEGRKGALKDAAQALGWYRRSAGSNVAEAQSDLGAFYNKCMGGLVVDHAEAARLFTLAAAQGLARAQYNLGNAYRDGKGVLRNHAEAVRLHRLAAEQGHASAQGALGAAYITGNGVARDYAAAMLWARRAADQGNAIAEYNLGMLYKNGMGATRDPRAASLWFERAAKQGDEDAAQALRKFAAEGLPEAVAALRRLRLAP